MNTEKQILILGSAIIFFIGYFCTKSEKKTAKTYYTYKPWIHGENVMKDVYGQPILTKAMSLVRTDYEDKNEITLYNTGIITTKNKVIQLSGIEYDRIIDLKTKIIKDGLNCNTNHTWFGTQQPFLYFYDIDKTYMIRGECPITIGTTAFYALEKMLDTVI